MKRQPLLIFATILLVGGTAAAAASMAGSSADPLISQSYAAGTYINQIQQKASAAAQAVLTAAVSPKIVRAEQAYTDATIEASLEQHVLAALGGGGAMNDLSLSANATLTAQTGAEFCLTNGSAVVERGTLLNLSEGAAASAGDALKRNQIYLAADDGTVLRLTSAGTVRASGVYTQGQGSGSTVDSSAAQAVQYTAYADALSTLGLFQGSNKGYELGRTSTRVEGVVMLIRLLGKDNEAKNYKGSHPFTDVPAWAAPYVAYAYQNGFTSGISATAFGSSMELRYRDYMTFLLRALEYADADGDFSWSTADQFAVTVGIQTAAERSAIQSSGKFLRDHVAYTSFRTLFLKTKSGRRLCDKLLLAGVYSQDQLIEVEEKNL